MEVVVSFFANHKFVNRGFLIGPYCPIYGFGGLLILFFLSKYREDPITLFLMAMFICSLLEYFTSFLLEKIFHARWWDYSNKKFNINGRICMETLIPFGLLGCFIVYLLNPILLKGISFIPTPVFHIVVFVCFLLFWVDVLVSFEIISSFKHELKKAERDRTEEITKKTRRILAQKGLFHKRLLTAFPNLKTSKEVLVELRNKIDKTLKQKKKKQKNGFKRFH